MLFWRKLQGSVWILWKTSGETPEQGRPGVRLVSFHNDKSKKPKLRLFFISQIDPTLIHINIRGRRPLRLQQIYYAALDAYVGLEIYLKLIQMAEEKGIAPDRLLLTWFLGCALCNQFGIAIGLLMKAWWQNAQVVQGVDDGPHPWRRQKWLVIKQDVKTG